LAKQELLESGGVFGATLHVLQQRHVALEEFHRLLKQAVGTVEGQLPEDKQRCWELLSYLQRLVYHFRNKLERAGLLAELERSIQSPSLRKEIHAMGQTIEEAIHEEGEQQGIVKGKQQSLIQLLRRKFGRKVTAAIVANIQKTKDLAILDEWLGNFVNAGTVDEVGIPVKKG
jgi:hypothetical protein